MGKASVDISALEHLINQLQVIEDEFADTIRMLKDSSSLTWAARYIPYYPIDDFSYKAWRTDWETTLRKTLGLAYDMDSSYPGFGPRTAVPDIEESDIADTPVALTSQERRPKGAEIGAKIATGQDLTPEEWDYLYRYRNDTVFASGLYSNATPAQVAALAAAQAEGFDAMMHSFGVSDLSDLSNLTPEQQEDLRRAQADYRKHLAGLGGSLATWSNIPGNNETVANNIITALQGGGAVSIGMTLILSYGNYNIRTTLLVANAMYDWDKNRDSSTTIDLNVNAVYRDADGNIITEPVIGVMGMLANNPFAANIFFTSGSEETVTIKGMPVPVNEHIKWAIDHHWDDYGDTAGRAFAAASVPTAGDDGSVAPPSEKQAQVASQLAAWIAYQYAQAKLNGEYYGVQYGIGNAIAAILGWYGADGTEIANDKGNHGSFGRGNERERGAGFGLGLSPDMYGLAIQALCKDDSTNAAILMQGWVNSLPEYMTRWLIAPGETAPSVEDILNFLRSPGMSNDDHNTPADLLYSAAWALDFIYDNARQPWKDDDSLSEPEKARRDAILNSLLGSISADAAVAAMTKAASGAGVPGQVFSAPLSVFEAINQGNQAYREALEQLATQQANQDIDGAVDAASQAAALVWLQILAALGYFTPETVGGWSNAGDPSYYNPFEVDLGNGQTGSAIVQDEDGTYRFDFDSEAGQVWLRKSEFYDAGYGEVYSTHVGVPRNPPGRLGVSTDHAVKLP